mmetsp:Transcript_45832/g.121125  ORF Transcript_45832/g.121125 Transcript_45832/m.121125 type:complete len:105 (+) Transcript_45832:225-539(+)
MSPGSTMWPSMTGKQSSSVRAVTGMTSQASRGHWPSRGPAAWPAAGEVSVVAVGGEIAEVDSQLLPVPPRWESLAEGTWRSLDVVPMIRAAAEAVSSSVSLCSV